MLQTLKNTEHPYSSQWLCLTLLRIWSIKEVLNDVRSRVCSGLDIWAFWMFMWVRCSHECCTPLWCPWFFFFFFFFLRTNKNPTEVAPCLSRCGVSEMMWERSETVVWWLSGVFIYSSCFCISVMFGLFKMKFIFSIIMNQTTRSLWCEGIK